MESVSRGRRHRRRQHRRRRRRPRGGHGGLVRRRPGARAGRRGGFTCNLRFKSRPGRPAEPQLEPDAGDPAATATITCSSVMVRQSLRFCRRVIASVTGGVTSSHGSSRRGLFIRVSDAAPDQHGDTVARPGSLRSVTGTGCRISLGCLSDS